jgi:hypothetical protein
MPVFLIAPITCLHVSITMHVFLIAAITRFNHMFQSFSLSPLSQSTYRLSRCTDYIFPVLHPRHKLAYFRKAGWEAEWVETANEIIRNEFNRSYAKPTITTNSSEEDAKVRTLIQCLLIFYSMSFAAGVSHSETEGKISVSIHSLNNIGTQESENIFDNLPTLVQPTAMELQDELDRYLSTDPEQTDNVFAWWNERKAAFPCLSRMALDYLCIPSKSSYHFSIRLFTEP